MKMDARTVRDTLAGLGVYPDRRRGQTFLVDEAVADREISSAAIGNRDVVLEIGGGLGILTSRLLQHAGRVFVIESDARLAGHLRNVCHDAVLIEGDALEVELPDFDVAVGNLPYSSATQILFRLASQGMRRGLFMLQKEVAKRIVARPGQREYSRITVMLKRMYESSYLFEVGHSHFYPQPDVDSAVLYMERVRQADNSEAFKQTVSALFSHRRKTIRSALKEEDLLPSAHVPYADRRAEELDVHEMEELACAVFGAGEEGERKAENFRRRRCR